MDTHGVGHAGGRVEHPGGRAGLSKGPSPQPHSQPPAVNMQGNWLRKNIKRREASGSPGVPGVPSENIYISGSHFNDNPQNFCKQEYVV